MKIQNCHFSTWTFLSICTLSVVSFVNLCIPVFLWKSLGVSRYTTAFQCQSMSPSIRLFWCPASRLSCTQPLTPQPSEPGIQAPRTQYHLWLLLWPGRLGCGHSGHLTWILRTTTHVMLGQSVPGPAVKWRLRLNKLKGLSGYQIVLVYLCICNISESPRPMARGEEGGRRCVSVSGSSHPSTLVTFH